MLCWSQDLRKDWSLCNSSESHSSASGERAQKMEEPLLLTEMDSHLWLEARLAWKQAKIHQPLYFIWSSISAPWPHFTLLGLVLLGLILLYLVPWLALSTIALPVFWGMQDTPQVITTSMSFQDFSDLCSAFQWVQFTACPKSTTL